VKKSAHRGATFILDQETSQKILLSIADLVIEATPAAPGFSLQVGPAHARFLIARGEPHLRLAYHYGRVPEIAGNLMFDSGGPWKWYHRDSANIIAIALPDNSEAPFRVAVLDAQLSRGEVFIQAGEQGAFGPETGHHQRLPALDPFQYPLDEVLLMHYLARGRGVLVHACGVALDGRGLLFPGVSGAGKSTLAELWKSTSALLLSDDRIIIRPGVPGFTMYGTPWHGDARTSSPEGAPLKKIFFLEQAHGNYAQEISPADAAARLLVRCFPPFYDKAAMTFVVDLISRLAEEVPCFELGFVPDASVIDFVRGLG
jgi:hypothetical protein